MTNLAYSNICWWDAVTPGAYCTVHTNGRIGKLIRTVTRSEYNHVFVYLGDGYLIEAQRSGVCLSLMSDYTGVRMLTSTDHLTPEVQVKLLSRADTLRGRGYGFIDIAALLLESVGIRSRLLAWFVARTDRLICSQLVDYLYRDAGVELFDDHRLSQNVTPGDLAARPGMVPVVTQATAAR